MSGKLKIIIIWMGSLFLALTSYAQTGTTFTGHLMENGTGGKVELAAVQLLELNMWTTSNNQGNFLFNNVLPGKYTLQVACLGYEPYEKVIRIDREHAELTIIMTQTSLALNEVVVVAKENTSMSSSSKIESTALSHVQPSSLADVMQLVPGQITLNPNMAASNQISIRDINTANKPDDNSAMGTAIVLDGTPMNNDANLQTLNTAGGGTAQAYSTSGQGIDLRKVATDNIESVEVIRGIPSVEYGDLTTGIVLVRTKAGKTKLNARVKGDPKIKQVALSKGFLLPGSKNGAMNIDVDYSHAYDDLRKPSKSYKRITGQLGYTNTLFKDSKPLSINVKLNYYNTLDNAKNDPDLLREEILQEKEENAGIKLFGKWSIKKSWLNNISYNFSGDYTKQVVFEHRVTTNAGATALPTAMVSGQAAGSILPTRYISDLTIDGQPYNLFGAVKGYVANDFGKASHNLMLGAEWRSSGNNGKGKLYDLTKPPTGASSTRPRAFNDIPVSRDFALYAEELVQIPIGSTSLKSQFGLRFNNMLPKGIFGTDGFITWEPRINLTYTVLKRKESNIIRDLALHGGFGKTSKNPAMIFMYPDKSYQDEMSFNYYPDLIVITTRVIDDTSNPSLKPITNSKYEAGIDLNVKGIKTSLTAFAEKIINGYTWQSQYFVMDYNKWDQIAGAGKQPQYQNSAITYVENGLTKTLPYSAKKEFHSYNSPRNNYDVDKKGVEYIVNFGKIKSLKSTIMVDGAYYHIRKTENVQPWQEHPNASYLGERFPYVTMLPGGKGNVRQRLNSNINISTHIPKIRMIVSVASQIIWIDKTAWFWNYDGKNVAYSLSPTNEKIYGNYELSDKIYVDPIGYTDKQMQYHEWQSSNSFVMPYNFMIKVLDHNYFVTESYPVTWQVNLKLTKEIGDKAQLSFYANNFFNQRPMYKTARSDSYVRMNQTAYFGAELKLTL